MSARTMLAGLGAFVALSALAVRADVPPAVSELFAQGNRLYRGDDFAGARQAYESILDAGYYSAGVYYNLGNTALKTGDLGRAVWAYLRAARLDPGDQDVRANLAYARALTSDAPPSADRSRALELAASLAGRVSARSALSAALGLYWIAALLLSAGLLTRGLLGALAKRGAQIAGALLVVVLVYAGARAAAASAGDAAVVLPAVLEVKSAPGEDGKSVFTLHAGTEVRTDRTLGGWVEISLGRELTGWVPERAVAVI